MSATASSGRLQTNAKRVMHAPSPMKHRREPGSQCGALGGTHLLDRLQQGIADVLDGHGSPSGRSGSASSLVGDDEQPEAPEIGPQGRRVDEQQPQQPDAAGGVDVDLAVVDEDRVGG